MKRQFHADHEAAIGRIAKVEAVPFSVELQQTSPRIGQTNALRGQSAGGQADAKRAREVILERLGVS